MGYTVTDTTVRAGTKSRLEYRRHLEACYCIDGHGEVVDAQGRSHPLEPGVFYALDDQALRRSLPPRVRECPFLVQEFRRGVGMGVEVLARNGEIRASRCHG